MKLHIYAIIACSIAAILFAIEYLSFGIRPIPVLLQIFFYGNLISIVGNAIQIYRKLKKANNEPSEIK